ncbi:MAG: hypothetical protein ACMUHX_06525 [bacterium]
MELNKKKINLVIITCLVILLLIIKQTGSEVIYEKNENPHMVNTKEFAPICKSCHEGDPLIPEESFIINEELSEICQSCHKKLPYSCMEASTPAKTAYLLEKIPNLVLKIVKGSLICDSCHLVHAGSGKRMKPEYFIFLKQAERINPHQAGIFCIFCHEKEPIDEDDPLNLKFDGDRVLICTQCHDNKRVRADNHPVNRIPSEGKGVEVDERFPLYEGKITCLTCHDIPCKGEETTPKFLRGGPYENRVDACLVCHKQESYKAVNPHEQIDENGRIRKDRCLYCHYIGPA